MPQVKIDSTKGLYQQSGSGLVGVPAKLNTLGGNAETIGKVLQRIGTIDSPGFTQVSQTHVKGCAQFDCLNYLVIWLIPAT